MVVLHRQVVGALLLSVMVHQLALAVELPQDLLARERLTISAAAFDGNRT